MHLQIDLTENRDFAKDRDYSIAGFLDFKWKRLEKYLWCPERFINDTNYIKDKGLIATGNSNQRYYKSIPEFGTHGYCDCCGKIVASYLWEFIPKVTGLCRTCSSQGTNSLNDKILWR